MCETRLVSCSVASNGIPRFAVLTALHRQKRSSLSSLAQLAKRLHRTIISTIKKPHTLVKLFYGAGDEAFLGFPPRSGSFAFEPLAQPRSIPSLSGLALCASSVRKSAELRNWRVLAIISTIKKPHTLVELFYGAGDEARPRDILLGKEAFYH